jgi:hypothetical protein
MGTAVAVAWLVGRLENVGDLGIQLGHYAASSSRSRRPNTGRTWQSSIPIGDAKAVKVDGVHRTMMAWSTS